MEVFCEELNIPGSWYRGDATAVCLFRLSDGSVFSYRGSWSADGFQTSWQSQWRVLGANGTAVWDGESIPEAEVRCSASEAGEVRYRRVSVSDTWKGRSGHQGCIDEMHAALLEGRRAETDCADNIKSLAMVFGALQSARNRRWVDLETMLSGERMLER